MSDRTRRKELVSQYKQSGREAGVYRIVNTQTGKMLLGSTPDLGSVRNKLKFGKSTNSIGVLDHRLLNDARQHGIKAFEVEVVETLETTPEMTPADIREELAVLEAICREQVDPALLY